MSYNPLLNDGCNVFYRPYRKKIPLLEGGIMEYDVKLYRYDNYGTIEQGYIERKWHFYNPCTLSNGPTAWGKDQENPTETRFFCKDINLYPKSASYTHHGSGNLKCQDGYWVLVDNNGNWIPPRPDPAENSIITWTALENWLQHYTECEYDVQRANTDGAVPFAPCSNISGVCTPVMEITGSRMYPSGYSNCEDPEETDLHNYPCTAKTIEYNKWIPNPSNLFDAGLGGLLGGKPGIGAGVSVSTGVFSGQKIWTKKHPNKDHCHELWRRKIDVRPGIGIGVRAGEGKLSVGSGPSVGIEFNREKVGELCSDRGCPPPLVQGIECGRYQEPSGCCPDNLMDCNIAGFVCCYDPEDCELVKRCRV